MTKNNKKQQGKSLNDQLIDEILTSVAPSDMFSKDGFFADLKRNIVNRMLDAEMNNHLGYSRHDKNLKETSNRRNGNYPKKILDEEGHLMEISVPRDRESAFEPIIIPKGVRRFTGFDDKVISMYARGMSVREIQGHIEEIYGTSVSSDLISEITDSVIEEVEIWQNRPLDKIYPIIYLDCIHVKARDNHTIINKAVYLAVGVNMEGKKNVLGIWIAKTEGAKFWMQVVNELKNRGVEDVLIACIDGLKGFEEAINAIFPKTTIQLCIVHMIRNSLKYVPWRDKKIVAADLKLIYTAISEEEAERKLLLFKEKWDNKYPVISDIWSRNWAGITPFFVFPEFIRKAVYTTNAIEAINRQIRKIIKNKGVFPNDNAVKKIIFLTLNNAQKKWTMPIQNWPMALNQFAILFNDRIDL